MIPRFVEVLHNIGFEPTAEEIADMLWLASHLDPPVQQEGEEPPAPRSTPSKTTTGTVQHASEEPQKDKTNTPSQPESTDSQLYLPPGPMHATTGAGFGGLPFRSLAASALPGTLALGRALRPLMRRVPSRTRFVLDEEATVQRIADEGYRLPVLRPAHARWLKVALIVDEWPSMVIWRQTIAELQRLLERHGAFRNVQTWSFTIDAENGRVRLRAGTGSEAPYGWTRSPRELIDPSGQQMILVVSDCVSPGWFNGEVARVLAQWGQNALVTIVHMLPERLWRRSALGHAASVHLRTRLPGTPNAQLEIEWPWYLLNNKSPVGLPVPVVTLEPRSLASWAQFVAGMGEMCIPGVILPTAPSDEAPPFDQEAVSASASNFALPLPVELLQMFQATVSPLARQLAGYLAATPLSLPVMRLVQRVMLPESRQVHLAEVFLSGLITRQTPEAPAIHPDDVQYDFVDGVRELLLSTILVSDAMEVLTHVANFITRQTGSSFNFRALIADPTATEGVVIDEGNRPFATVTARVLRQLGGQYAQLASRLEQRLGGVHLPSVDVAISPEVASRLEVEATATAESTQHRLDRVRHPRVHITYDVEIGGAIEMKELRFVVGVLADLSGRSDAPLPQLRDRKFIEVDRDNFNAVLQSIRPHLAYQVNNTLANDDTKISVDLRFSTMDDFNPEQVVGQIEPLRRLLAIRTLLAALRAKTDGNDRFSELLQTMIRNTELLHRVRQEAEELPVEEDPNAQKIPPEQAETRQIAPGEESLLDQLISEGRIGRDEEQRTRSRQQIVTLVEEVMQGTVRVSEDLEATLMARIADIDTLLSRQLNAIMHAPEFQRLEATWRGLHYLVNETKTGALLKIQVLNVSKSELHRDLERATAFDQSALFKKAYEETYGIFGGEPFGALIGDYEFGRQPQDVALLEKLAHIAASVHAPFIAAASPQMFDLDNFTDLGIPRDLAKIFDTVTHAQWRSFRESEDSRYIGLTLAHILMRLPYGTDTVPVEAFDFREDVDAIDHSKYLWGNAAYAFGTRLSDAFAKYGWCAAIRGVEGGGLVEGLPTHFFMTAEGDVALKCPTEIAITDRREKELSDLGFIPLTHCKGTDYAAFFSVPSCQQVRRYDTPAANANARLSVQFPYIMAVCRFAHYLKVMTRDKIGSFMTRTDWEYYLNRWISHYVLANDDAGSEMKARYPLREARIEVVEAPDQPGVYRAVAFLRPHFQLDELTVSLRAVVTLPSSAIGGSQQEAMPRLLPGVLLDRAEQHRAEGAFTQAQRELDDAISLAERENMGQDQVDGHLAYTRLYLAMGDKGKARQSLETAKEMMARMDYHQRDKEAQELEVHLLGKA